VSLLWLAGIVLSEKDKRYEYFRPYFPKAVEDEIKKLFEQDPELKMFCSDNPVRYVEFALKKTIERDQKRIDEEPEMTFEEVLAELDRLREVVGQMRKKAARE
jgi:hypothetical protein